MDLAASIQKVCEESVLRTARHVHRLTGMRNLVMAGGVALNCVANGRVIREGPFKNIWVQPAAGDARGSTRRCADRMASSSRKPRVVNPQDSQKGSLLGPAFRNDDIRLFLDSVGARYHFYEDEGTLLRRWPGYWRPVRSWAGFTEGWSMALAPWVLAVFLVILGMQTCSKI